MKAEVSCNIETYLEKTQQLGSLNEDQRILEFIEKSKNQPYLPRNFQSLFDAEEAFYKHHFKTALKNYLKAKNTPFYEFFCFRASAYASEEINNYLKAIQFAKKALRIRPNDYTTLVLLARTYTSIDQRDKAQEIYEKLKGLSPIEERTEKKEKEQEDSHHFIPVGEQELEELSQIFAKKGPEQASLFACEASSKHTYENDTSPVPGKDWEKESVVLPPGCDLFSHSPKPWESEESLTKRLYETNEAPKPPFIKASHLPFTNQKLIEDYYQLYRRRTNNQTNFLFSCNHSNQSLFSYPINGIVECPQKSFMIHWEGHGVAVNPGKNFLDSIHQYSLFIQDIQTILVTDPQPDSLEAIKKLYSLSAELSKHNLTSPITFHLHPTLYEQLKTQWPNHQQVYKLVKSWNIEEKMHCKTCFENKKISGVTITCKNKQQNLSITYLTQKPQTTDHCDLLIMDACNANAEEILAINPRISILYHTNSELAHERLHGIRKLQNHLTASIPIIPTTNYLNVQLRDLSIQTEEGQNSYDVSDLCAVATSQSTIALVPKQSVIKL
ncbi:MAG: tetratricopeptide repeat protein [Chlamydiota bacterium]